MPKKKPQHKRQNKALDSEESFPEGKINEAEVYETVVDFDQSGKFRKRRLESNWAKYEIPPTAVESDEGDEETQTGAYDYNFLVENASSDFSHFEFAFEKSRKEEKPIINNRIFKLDLNVLSSGLACIPFYERIGLDEEKISEEDKKRCDEEAKRNWEKYQVIRENFIKNNLKEKKDVDDKNKELSRLQLNTDFKKSISDFTFFPEHISQAPEVSESNPKQESITKVEFTQKPEEKGQNLEDWLDKALLLSNEETLSAEGKSQEQKKLTINESTEKQELKALTQPQSQKVIFSNAEENLEDWLDSVLDD